MPRRRPPPAPGRRARPRACRRASSRAAGTPRGRARPGRAATRRGCAAAPWPVATAGREATTPASPRIPRCQRTVFGCSPSRRPSSCASRPLGAPQLLDERGPPSGRRAHDGLRFLQRLIVPDTQLSPTPAADLRIRINPHPECGSRTECARLPFSDDRRNQLIEGAPKMAYPAAHETPRPGSRLRRRGDSGALFKIATLLLGLLVGVMAIVGIFMLSATRNAQHSATPQPASPAQAMTMPMDDADAGRHDRGRPPRAQTATPSFAGVAPANAAALAAAHVPYPAALPALTPGPVLAVKLPITHATIQVAPGIKYAAWTFGRPRARPDHPRPPGPDREGDTHEQRRRWRTRSTSTPPAWRPNVAFVDVLPGKSFTFSFKANDPGVFMYHCGTKPVLAHIANGMYGAIVVEPKAGVLPHADKQYVLVAERVVPQLPRRQGARGARHGQGPRDEPGLGHLERLAGQYVKHPLTANPGENVRLWVDGRGPFVRHRFPRRGHDPQQRLAERRHGRPAPARRADRARAGRRRRRLRRQDRQGRPLPVVSHSFASVDMGQVGAAERRAT